MRTRLARNKNGGIAGYGTVCALGRKGELVLLAAIKIPAFGSVQGEFFGLQVQVISFRIVSALGVAPVVGQV